MYVFKIPQRGEVSPANQKYFDFFHDRLGLMPNLYAALAYSESALTTYIQLQNRKHLLKREEREIIALVVSTFNSASYCLETHTMIARLNGFSDEQIENIKNGAASFNARYDALIKLVTHLIAKKGQPKQLDLSAFFDVGYTKAHLVELILCIGDSIISNLLSCTMNIPLDSHPELIK